MGGPNRDGIVESGKAPRWEAHHPHWKARHLIAAGKIYAPGSENASKNYLVPWLRTLFGSLGIKNMQFVLADGTRATNKGKIDRAAFLAPHVEAIHTLFAQESLR